MGLLLVFADAEHSVGVAGDVIFNSNTNLPNELESKTSILVAVITCADVEELWVESPELGRNRNVIFVPVENQKGDTIDSLLDRVETVRRETVQQARINHALNLVEQVDIAANRVNNPPHRSEWGNSSQDSFSVVVFVFVLLDQSYVLLLQMLADFARKGPNVVLENHH